MKTKNELVRACSWCQKIQSADGEWSDTTDEMRQAYQADMRLTFGICPPCYTDQTAIPDVSKTATEKRVDALQKKVQELPTQAIGSHFEHLLEIMGRSIYNINMQMQLGKYTDHSKLDEVEANLRWISGDLGETE